MVTAVTIIPIATHQVTPIIHMLVVAGTMLILSITSLTKIIMVVMEAMRVQPTVVITMAVTTQVMVTITTVMAATMADITAEVHTMAIGAELPFL